MSICVIAITPFFATWPVFGQADDYFEKYDLTCQSETDTSSFSFLQQPWLNPDRLATIEEYGSLIAAIESEHGVYSELLITQLTGLGAVYKQASKHAAAAEVYQRALDVLKINEGLYSPNQVPLLDILIEENSKISNWERVSDHFRYMHWLYRRNFAADDPRLLTALKRIRQWEINSYNKATGISLDEQFRVTEQLHDQIINILSDCTDDKKLAYCFIHKGCCPEAPEHTYCPLNEN